MCFNTNAHLLVEFGLNLLLTLIKRTKVRVFCGGKNSEESRGRERERESARRERERREREKSEDWEREEGSFLNEVYHQLILRLCAFFSPPFINFFHLYFFLPPLIFLPPQFIASWIEKMRNSTPCSFHLRRSSQTVCTQSTTRYHACGHFCPPPPNLFFFLFFSFLSFFLFFFFSFSFLLFFFSFFFFF